MNEKCAACIHCEVCGFIESEVARDGACDFYEDGEKWELTKEEKALLQKWRDNRGISMKDFEDAMDSLEQEPKTGHWKVVSDGYGDNAYICECSECKDTVWVYKDADRKWNFCPNCGAKMGVEE